MKTWLMAPLTALALALPLVAAQAAEQSADTQKQMMQMQDRMKTMQEQMNRIHQTTDPAERQKLMQEHMQSMQAQMKDMRAMGGGMMMGQGGSKGMHGGGMMDPKARGKMTQDRMAAGFQIGFHAIGDKAVQMGLDAFAEAEKMAHTKGIKARDGTENYRLRIEHAQVTNPLQVARFRELKVIASMQPSHLLTDMRWALLRLGPSRAAHSGVGFPTEPSNKHALVLPGDTATRTSPRATLAPETVSRPPSRVNDTPSIASPTVPRSTAAPARS